MIKMSGGLGGEKFSAVVIVAFDPASGDVHATYVHGHDGPSDEGGIERGRQRLLADVRERLGSHAEVALVQVPLAEVAEGWIERVDSQTRKVVVRRNADKPSGLSHR